MADPHDQGNPTAVSDPILPPLPLLTDPADGEALQSFLAGWLMGALLRADCPLELELEPHTIGDRFLPSFEARLGRTTLVVHVDLSIDRG
jgi:hypothetical protein